MALHGVIGGYNQAGELNRPLTWNLCTVPSLTALDIVGDSQSSPKEGETLSALIPEDTCALGWRARERSPRCARRVVSPPVTHRRLLVCEMPSAHALCVAWGVLVSCLQSPCTQSLHGSRPGTAHRPVQGLTPGAVGRKSPRKEHQGLKNEGHPPVGSQMRQSGCKGTSKAQPLQRPSGREDSSVFAEMEEGTWA